MSGKPEETPSAADVPHEGYDVDSAADALLARWKTADGPSETGTEGEPRTEGNAETPPAPAEEDEEHAPEEKAEEPEAPEEKTAEKLADDDAVTTVKVGEDEYRVSVKDLKRLYGQEQALTKKSQEVAEQRKAVETEGQKYATGLAVLVEKAQARWKPYSEIDWMVTSQRVPPETFAQLRADAKEAFEDYKFLVEELDGHMQKTADQAHQTLRERAKETVKALRDPQGPHHIEGWNDEVYQSLIEFAVDHGVPAEVMANETSPATIKIIWMAQQYLKAKREAARVAKAKTTTPAVGKKVLKPGAGGAGGTLKEIKRVEAMSRLQKTGDLDDAANVFLARWRERED